MLRSAQEPEGFPSTVRRTRSELHWSPPPSAPLQAAFAGFAGHDTVDRMRRASAVPDYPHPQTSLAGTAGHDTVDKMRRASAVPDYPHPQTSLAGTAGHDTVDRMRRASAVPDYPHAPTRVALLLSSFGGF